MSRCWPATSQRSPAGAVDGKATRSLREVDGRRRVLDALALMRPVQLEGKTRHMIYPGDDERCLRVVRKVVRGLSYAHRLRWPALGEGRPRRSAAMAAPVSRR
jgi:hypothetical protein